MKQTVGWTLEEERQPEDGQLSRDELAPQNLPELVANAKRWFEDSRKRFIGLGPAQRQMQSLQRASLNSLRMHYYWDWDFYIYSVSEHFYLRSCCPFCVLVEASNQKIIVTFFEALCMHKYICYTCIFLCSDRRAQQKLNVLDLQIESLNVNKFQSFFLQLHTNHLICSLVLFKDSYWKSSF